MVRRQTRVKSMGTRRRAVRPTSRQAPTVAAVRPETAKAMNARFEAAGRSLQVTSRVAARFARSSMREVSGAVKASREPMTVLWRNVRLAGRHIVRDAAAAWNEVVPVGREMLQFPVRRGLRRTTA